MRRIMISAVVMAVLGLVGCGGGGGSGGGSSGGGGVSGAPPVITSAPAVTVYSGQSGSVYTVTATEAGSAPVSYALSGTDAARFSIDSTTGAVSFVAAPSYDAPIDSDLDNEYLLNVTASAGGYSTTASLSVQVTKNVSSAYVWNDAPWGGGGFITGLVYHPKTAGLLYARSNTGGAFRWDAANGRWISLTDFAGGDGALNVLSIALDPNDDQKVYLAVGNGNNGAILISSDRGATWSKVSLPFSLDGLQYYTSTGEKLVVDPNDSRVLYLGSNDGTNPGVYKSVDSGHTWSRLSLPGIIATFIAVDPQSGSPGHASQKIWIGTYITLFASTDSGATWAGVTYPGLAATPLQAAFDGHNHMYMTVSDRDDVSIPMRGSLFKLDLTTGSWSDVSPLVPTSSDQFGYEGVAVDPQHPSTVMVTLNGGGTGRSASVFRSTDGGGSWTNLMASGHFSTSEAPWMANVTGRATDLTRALTDIEINPFNASEAVFNTAYGVYMSSDVTSSGATDWTFRVHGMDLYYASGTVSPRAGGTHLLVANAFGGARYTDFSDADRNGFFTGSFSGGGMVDDAELNPAVAIRLLNGSGKGGAISTDYGATWTDFPDATPYFTSASFGTAGSAAVSAKATSIAWCNADGKYYTSSNNGGSWTAGTGPLGCHYLQADRTRDGVFYSLDGRNGIINRSIDGGMTYSSFVSGLDTDIFTQFVVVPWKQGDIWVASAQGLYHLDGTATAVKLSNVTSAIAIGYGAPAPGKAIHSLYLCGTVAGVQGIFRSDDNGASWTRINDDLHQFGQIDTLSGDPRVWGRVYLSTASRGVIVGNRF